MGERSFFAPGKVVLLGEYAVIDGAPALVAAVNRGVACHVTPSDRLVIETPAADDRFVRPALEACHAPAARYRFTDHNPPNTPTKAGLGGSASATVAAILAGSTLAGHPLDPSALRALAHAVHHRVQGSGSGIDIAAAAIGGVLRFQAGLVTPRTAPELHVAYSGTSASTGPRVQQYQAWAQTEPAAHQHFLDASASLVEAFDAAPIESLREARALLTAMSQAAGIAYWTPGLTALCDLAHAHGGAAKPSGAGGGDIAVAMFDDPDHAQDWTSACERAGFVLIPTTISPGATEISEAAGAPRAG